MLELRLRMEKSMVRCHRCSFTNHFPPDFQGPMTIGVDNLAFGAPMKLVHLFTENELKQLSATSTSLDEAIRKGSEDYTHQWWFVKCT